MHASIASLEEASLLLSAGVPSGEQRERRFGYTVCGTGFLVPKGLASEIVTTPVIHALPWMTPCLRGLLNQRGNVVPIFDLAPLFDQEQPHIDRAHVLILDTGERAVGVMMDTLPTVVTCTPQTDIDMTALPTLIARAVQCAYAGAGQIWYEVNHATLYRAVAEAVLN